MDASPSNLLRCDENLSVSDTEDEIIVEGYDDDYIRVLLDKEASTVGLQMQDVEQNSWILEARLEGIDYIQRTVTRFGFRFDTCFVSIAYFDRFLAKRSIQQSPLKKSWAVRLLSIACLSLAGKMEENRVPPLPEFCGDGFNFESSVLKRMELLLLDTLGWKMGSVTPFVFTHFFANKLCDDLSALSTTVEVILAAAKDGKIMCHRPSVIAAAATLVVMDQELTRTALELKIAPLNLVHSFDIESIISCYSLFQGMDLERLKIREEVIKSPDLSPNRLLPHGTSSATSGSKRKRLVFDQDDDLGEVADEKKSK